MPPMFRHKGRMRNPAFSLAGISFMRQDGYAPCPRQRQRQPLQDGKQHEKAGSRGNRHIDADTGGMAGQLASSPTPNSIKSDNPIRGMKSS